MLRPGGAVGALWNGEDETVEWVAGLLVVAGTSVANTYPEGFRLPAHPLFEPAEHGVFPHTHRRTADSLAETLGTHSRMLVIAPEERDEVLTRIRTYLAARPETADGEFDVPLMTEVVRATRR